MADNTRGGSNDASLPLIATDDVGGVAYQRVKLDVGGDGATTPVTSTGMPVNDASGSLTVDGSVSVSNFPATQPVSGTVSVTGVATDAMLDARTGSLTETAPATDTASSGLNGRLQRIAQRLTSLIAVFNIGAGTEAAAVRVTLPTDGTGKVGLNAGTANIGDVDVLTVPAPLSTTGNGTAAAAHRVTLASDSTGQVAIASIAAGTTNIGDVDVLTVPAPLSTTGNGTAATALRVSVASDSTGQVAVASVPSPLSTAGNGTAATAHRVTIASDSTGQVAVASIAAGTSNIGDVDVLTLPVVNPIVRISQTPTVSTSPAYTAKDAVGGLLTFANAARVSAGSGKVQSVTIVDLSQQMPALDLVLFNQTFTNSTDNAVFDPTDGDLANVVGVIPVSNWADFNDNSVATRGDLNLPFMLTGTSLFGQLVTRSTPTFVGTSDIIVLLGIEQA